LDEYVPFIFWVEEYDERRKMAVIQRKLGTGLEF
jgi:hypothetical protein